MNVVNYDKLMLETLERLEKGKKMLLHSCCAPCSSYCLQELHGFFEISVLYYNPNLDGEEEYEKRKNEQIRLLDETGFATPFPCAYSPEDFVKIAAGREQLKEGGERCKLCYRLRLERTARLAKEHGYDYFATTLTVSPLKNAAALNEIGFDLEKEYGVKYLPTDFKKRGGYLQSIELSKRYRLYRQNYCGCAFSKRDAAKKEE